MRINDVTCHKYCNLNVCYIGMTIYVTLKSQRVTGKPLAKVETALPPLGTVLNGRRFPKLRDGEAQGTAGHHLDREKCGEEKGNRTLQGLHGARHSLLWIRKPPAETKFESKDLTLRTVEKSYIKCFYLWLFCSESLV